MANKIRTVMTYPLNGAVNFTITFDYLARKFIQVTLIGKDRKELVLNQDYRFTSKTQITTTRAWTAADGYQMIEIRRFTSATDRLVDFADGSILRAYDLNISQIQTLHVAEEARDLTADTIGVNNDGHLDARGRKIVNLAYATNDYDAVPLKQVKERESSAWNAVTKANEHADRSNKEANRSRDEANRAQREADRSTQQAGVSTQQAVESKKQADRSNSEANRAKGYAESMTASVAEAKKQADRSNSEANRARDEANRAAGEVTKAAAEVAKAAAHVETAKGHADRANTEANRSKSEADRAKTEADKLGNMNSLAEAIDRVEAPDVYFKRNVIAGHRLETSGGSHLHPNEIKLVNNKSPDQHFIVQAWGTGDPNNRAQVFEVKDNLGQYAFYIQRQKKTDQTWQMSVNGSLSCQIVNSNLGIESTNEKATVKFKTWGGGWDQWTGVGVPNVQHDIAGQGDVAYLLERATIWGKEHLYAKALYNNGNGASFFIRHYLRGAYFDLRSDGTLISSTGWNIPADGNLYIRKYGLYIDAWVNKRLGEHAYNKSETDNLVNGRLTQAQADGRYVRKNAGWAEVWEGSAGGGVSVGLSQDVRWRTIWIQTQGRWNPVQIGDNGSYYISSNGGWLQFTISNNGRTFRNDADRASVPTRILVQNQ
ncbi:tail fiber protein [Escherichia phage CarlSpitteler]|uniref:Tail fiber protein n=1 Tax=Escherichia phage CarlSpitteler TaxID=2852039 RepID=A0AAE8AXB0_9CAUD|nr:tail fiber protein [Escherichia phage CarlSpitteler]